MTSWISCDRGWVRELADGRFVSDFYPRGEQPPGIVLDIDVTPDGLTMIVGSIQGDNGLITFYDLRTKKQVGGILSMGGSAAGHEVRYATPVPRPLKAVADKELPLEQPKLDEFQRIIDLLPFSDCRWLGGKGVQVTGYRGNAITDLTRFAAWRGKPTGPTTDDPNRTYDTVPAAGMGNEVVANQTCNLTVIHHELGHVYFDHWSTWYQQAWQKLVPQVAWTTHYEQDYREAVAESMRRHWNGIPQPDPRIEPFINALVLP